MTCLPCFQPSMNGVNLTYVLGPVAPQGSGDTDVSADRADSSWSDCIWWTGEGRGREAAGCGTLPQNGDPWAHDILGRISFG